MAVALDTLRGLSEAELEAHLLSRPIEEHAAILAGLVDAHERSRQDWAILHYAPANPMAEPAHYSMAREIALSGGNRSSKTTTMFAEMVIQATGVIPPSLKAKYPTQKIVPKFRGRVVGPSLTDWIEPILKPKLRYTDWNGVGDPMDGRGHWGFIPRQLLRMSKWESAWNEKTRTLHIARDSSHMTGGVLMELRDWGTLQVMSNDQDLSSFAGSSLTFVGHDEIPRPDIYRENQLRTLDVKGQLWTAFTPPDEIGAAQGDSQWFFEHIFEPGQPGPLKHPNIESFTIFTEANRILDAETIEDMRSRLTEEQRAARFYGTFLHLSGAIYGKMWTPFDGRWCYRCVGRALGTGTQCHTCGGDDTGPFTHVIDDFPIPATWPVFLTADPHPRKPTAVGWFAVAPSDDVVMCGELAASGNAKDVTRQIFEYERAHGWRPAKRLGDPNILTQTNDLMEKGWTMRRAFSREGLHFDLANDAVNVGIGNVMDYLKADPRTRRPRLQVFRSCAQAIQSMGRWSWAEWKSTGQEREKKETVGDRGKDFADVIRYAINDAPRYDVLRHGNAPIRVGGGGRY